MEGLKIKSKREEVASDSSSDGTKHLLTLSFAQRPGEVILLPEHDGGTNGAFKNSEEDDIGKLYRPEAAVAAQTDRLKQGPSRP
jgi:hypothetical protein